MKNLKYIFVILLIGGLVLTVKNESAADDINNTNIDSFPKVTIELTIHNLNDYDKKEFKIQENGNNLEFKLEQIESKSIADERKNILILVERFSKKRINHFKGTLKGAIPQITKSGDKINIAVFDVVRDSGNKTIFPILPNFTDNIDSLLNAVESIKRKPNKYLRDSNGKLPSDVRLDLYQGIFEGLEVLNDNFIKNKFLIVFSAGRNNNAGTIKSDIIKQYAIKHNIPIYNMQYFIEGYGNTNLSDVAEETSGEHYNSQYVNKSVDKLVTFMKNAVVKNLGKTYRLTYTSSFPSDGAYKNINLSVDDKVKSIPINTPKQGILEEIWLSYKWLFFALLSLLFFAILILAFSFINNSDNETKNFKTDNDFYPDNYQNDINTKYTKSNKKNHNEKSIDMIAKMKKYGSLPILVYKKDNIIKHYTIKKPTISIGNALSNDLVIDDDKVENVHAYIYFDNNGYWIKSIKNSLIKVKGEKIKNNKKLQNTHRIFLGKSEIIFTI